MTLAPNAPITDASELREGDLVRHSKHGLCWVREIEPDVGLHVGWHFTDGVQLCDIFENFTFIGRPDPDGWMPWEGGENPVPGHHVEVKIRWRLGAASEGGVLSDRMDWRHKKRGQGEGGDIIAFRLTRPAAPVKNRGESEQGAVAGLETVAWRWETPIPHVGDGTRWGWSFASHRSTPPPSLNAEPLVTRQSAAAALEAAAERAEKAEAEAASRVHYETFTAMQDRATRAEALQDEVRAVLEDCNNAFAMWVGRTTRQDEALEAVSALLAKLPGDAS